MSDISKGKSVELRATLTQRGEVHNNVENQKRLKVSLKEKDNKGGQEKAK